MAIGIKERQRELQEFTSSHDSYPHFKKRIDESGKTITENYSNTFKKKKKGI